MCNFAGENKYTTTMKRHLFTTLCTLVLLFSAIALSAQTLPAFPGAEGFGMYTTGGRGGSVYHVTSLADNGGNGTLRKAVESDAARIVVFDVSGTIHLTRALAIKGNKTLLGQTAPGDGICVADYPVTMGGDNIIVRYMRFRLGNKYVANHEGDGLGSMDHHNIIVDHCSVSWSIDECLSVYGGKNITVQWCIASQSLKNAGHSKGAHGYGGNWGGSGASYHHNLVAHNESRTPRLGPRPGTQTDERMDMRNNVIYNWGGEGCYGGEGMNVNMVNNYYKPGPCTMKSSAKVQKRIAKIGIRTTAYTKHDTDKPNEWDVMWHKWGTFYVDGNYNATHSDVTADNWTTGIYNQIDNSQCDNTFNDEVKQQMHLDKPVSYYAVTTHSAKTAYQRVLNYAGCSLHRDQLDGIIVSDTREGKTTSTGSDNNPGIINTQDDVKTVITGTDSPWPTLAQSGSPLAVENEATIAANGYANIENAANDLVAAITEAQNADGMVLSGQDIFVNTDPTEYVLAPSTHTDGWNFNGGFSISVSGKNYSEGSSYGVSGIKYSAGTQYTISIPTGIEVSQIDFTGASNYDDAEKDTYLAECNGTQFAPTQYVFDDKTGGSNKTCSISFEQPLQGSLTFTPGGLQAVWVITLYGKTATGIGLTPATSPKGKGSGYYTLDGRRLQDRPAAKGLYIVNGKKVII